MTEPDDVFDGTLQYYFMLHQDLIDDCLVNPVPVKVAKVITAVYAEADRHGAAVLQWRITFGPAPAPCEQFADSPEELAYLAGRRVIKMTAYTTGGTVDSGS